MEHPASKSTKPTAFGSDGENLSTTQKFEIANPRPTPSAEIAVKFHKRNGYGDIGVGGPCAEVVLGGNRLAVRLLAAEILSEA